MPCGHLKTSRIHGELLNLDDSYAGALGLSQVLGAAYAQHQGLLNVTILLLWPVLPVCLAQFYVHRLKQTSNSCIHSIVDSSANIQYGE